MPPRQPVSRDRHLGPVGCLWRARAF